MYQYLPTLFLFLLISIDTLALSNVVMQEYHIDIEVTSDGKLTYHISELIKINNSTGLDLASFSLNHSEGTPIKSLRAQIETSSGKVIRKLKKSDIVKTQAYSNFAWYHDRLAMNFELKHHQFPYFIRIEYTQVYKEYLTITRWSPVWRYGVPTQNALLNVKFPVGYPVNIHTHNIESAETSQIEGFIKYSWRASYDGKYEHECYAPPMSELTPLVHIVPENFRYYCSGSNKSWREFGLWENKLNAERNQLPNEEIDKITDMVASSQTKKEKIAQLYHYLQDHTRYIYVGMEYGGLQVEPASSVCRNGYGDCKGLSNYMKSMLESIGIPAFYSSVYAGSNPKRILTDFPGNQFDHVILMVPLENDTVWLENTSQQLPFDYLGTFTQNRKALAVTPDGGVLVSTQVLSYKDCLNQRNYVVDIDKNRNATIDFKAKYRGDEFEDLLHVKTSPKKQQIETLERNLSLAKLNLSKVMLNHAHRDSTSINIEAKGVISGISEKFDNIYLSNIWPIWIHQFERPKYRNLPVRFNHPIALQDSILVTIPDSCKLLEMSHQDITIESDYGKYDLRATTNENMQVIFYRSLHIPAQDIQTSEYSDFYSFVTSISNHENKLQITYR